MNLVQKVEAVLYASESPLSAGDIAAVLSEPKEDVLKAIRQLIKDYGRRETCLTVARTGIRYKLQLKNEYSQIVSPVSRMEIDQIQLRILGFVAANPGCIRGEIIQRFGEKSRNMIQELLVRKFLSERKYRNTEVYNVTREFFRYFNVNKSDLESRLKGMAGDETAQ